MSSKLERPPLSLHSIPVSSIGVRLIEPNAVLEHVL